MTGPDLISQVTPKFICSTPSLTAPFHHAFQTPTLGTSQHFPRPTLGGEDTAVQGSGLLSSVAQSRPPLLLVLLCSILSRGPSPIPSRAASTEGAGGGDQREVRRGRGKQGLGRKDWGECMSQVHEAGGTDGVCQEGREEGSRTPKAFIVPSAHPSSWAPCPMWCLFHLEAQRLEAELVFLGSLVPFVPMPLPSSRPPAYIPDFSYHHL